MMITKRNHVYGKNRKDGFIDRWKAIEKWFVLFIVKEDDGRAVEIRRVSQKRIRELEYIPIL